MEMIMRWFGDNHDSVSLGHIRQVPGVTGVAATLMDKQAGEEWRHEEINSLRTQIESAGLTMPVIESVNVHDDIKLGLSTRDEYIEKYQRTIEALADEGVKVICYNFMPMFDWMRTNLAMKLEDGSNTMAYIHEEYEALGNPNDIIQKLGESSGGYKLPGWEPERLVDIERLFTQYEGITTEQLHENLQYFFQAIIPVCERIGVKMAIHPDDPPWVIYGLPRVYANAAHAEAILSLYPSNNNCLTLCTGSLGIDKKNSIQDIIQQFGSHIAFAHVRNFKRIGCKSFYESSHPSAEGSLDMYEIMKALYRHSRDCYIRPDHGRMIWDEQARAGYGLYDRALGAAYIEGLWEAVSKCGESISCS